MCPLGKTYYQGQGAAEVYMFNYLDEIQSFWLSLWIYRKTPGTCLPQFIFKKLSSVNTFNHLFFTDHPTQIIIACSDFLSHASLQSHLNWVARAPYLCHFWVQWYTMWEDFWFLVDSTCLVITNHNKCSCS